MVYDDRSREGRGVKGVVPSDVKLRNNECMHGSGRKVSTSVCSLLRDFMDM